MSVDRGDPEMRIPRNIDDNDQFYGYRTEDLVVGLLPAGAGLFISQSLLPESMGGLRIPLIASGLVLGALLLFFTPNHLTTREWLEGIGHNIRRPKKVRHVALEMNTVREATDAPDQARAWEVNQRTQELTRVKRIHTDVGVLERDDNVMVGGVKVSPANMALASPERWGRMVNEWKSFINHNLDFPVQVYCTTEVLPIDEYMSQYEARASDPDIANRPIMKTLLEDFTSWYPEYLSWQGTNQREYYILTTCSEAELRETVIGEQGFLERLSDIPWVGKYVDRLRASRDERSEGEIEEALIKSIEQRSRTIAKEGVMPLDGCSSQRVSGVEMAVMVKEYWESRESDLDLSKSEFRNQPVIQPNTEETVTTDEIVSTDGGFGDLKSAQKRKEEIKRLDAEQKRERQAEAEQREREREQTTEMNTDTDDDDGNGGTGDDSRSGPAEVPAPGDDD